jgi:hypothetical protein
MGSQLASFTLRPDIAHAFANLASYRKVPKDQLRVVEMDLTPEHVVMVGHHGERELVVDYGQGYNPDAVVEASVGERMSLRAAPETEEFKQFFAGSKVVDADGKPQVMYHGTRSDINEFKAGLIFTSPNSMVANKFAANDMLYSPDKPGIEPGANVMPVYVSASNPFDYENPEHVNKLFDLIKGNFASVSRPAAKRLLSEGQFKIIEENADVIKDMGFDSLYVEEFGEKNLAVFNPTQIKSAIGNTGAYSQYNPDIRYSLRDSTDPDTLTRVNETTTTREEKGYVERITQALGGDTYSQLRAQSLNRYNRLSDVDKAVVKKRGGAALMADESAEAGALQSDLAAGVTASALGVHDRNGGIPIFANGVTKVFNDGGKIKGPVAIFAPLSKYNDPLIYQLYQFWAAAQRGSRLNEQGKPDIFTDDDLKRAERLER